MRHVRAIWTTIFLLCGLILSAKASMADEPAFSWAENSASSARAVVIVIHGLNLKPSRMEALVKHLQLKGSDVLRIALTGHRGDVGEFRKVTADRWLRDFLEGYRMARERADRKHLPLHLMAYSLGALVAETALNTDATVRFDRAALLAPAVALRARVKWVKLLGIFGSGFVLRSANLPEYRANEGTPLAAYWALFDLLDRLNATGFARAHLPTLILVDPDDELVSLSGIEELKQKYRLDEWRITILSNKGSRLSHTYHHLMVDEVTAGPEEWKKMLSLIDAQLGLSKPLWRARVASE